MTARAVLLFAVLWPVVTARASAHSAQPAHAGRVIQRLRTDITVPQDTYPRGALVPVTIAVQNISSRPVALRKTCGYGYVWAEVVDASGHAVFPPALSSAPKPVCSPARSTSILRPGQTDQLSLIVWLRETQIRVMVSLPKGTAPGASLTLHLTGGDSPTVTSTSKTRYRAVVEPAGTVHGPLEYAAVTTCDASHTSTAFPGSRTHWRTSNDGVVQVSPPSCPSGAGAKLDWGFVAGWVGRPAVVWHS